jgi:hypothetical protein
MVTRQLMRQTTGGTMYGTDLNVLLACAEKAWIMGDVQKAEALRRIAAWIDKEVKAKLERQVQEDVFGYTVSADCICATLPNKFMNAGYNFDPRIIEYIKEAVEKKIAGAIAADAAR